jgi:hypothetical protein
MAPFVMIDFHLFLPSSSLILAFSSASEALESAIKDWMEKNRKLIYGVLP